MQRTELDYALLKLKRFKEVLPRQTLKTLRGQAINGDIDGAMRGLSRLLEKGRAHGRQGTQE